MVDCLVQIIMDPILLVSEELGTAFRVPIDPLLVFDAL